MPNEMPIFCCGRRCIHAGDYATRSASLRRSGDAKGESFRTVHDGGEYAAAHSSLWCVLMDSLAERRQQLAEMTGIQLFAVLDTRRKATGRSLRTHSRTSTVPNNQPTRREAATMRYRLLAACRSQPTARGIVESEPSRRSALRRDSAAPGLRSTPRRRSVARATDRQEKEEP